jgi:hypothetical protein
VAARGAVDKIDPARVVALKRRPYLIGAGVIAAVVVLAVLVWRRRGSRSPTVAAS